MALFSLADLTAPATRDEVQASIYRVLGTLGVKTSSWEPGAVTRTMIVGVSAVLAAFSQLQARIAASGFLDLSEGSWLTLVARYVYGVERIDPTFAAGALTLTNSGGGLYLLDPGDLIASNASTGKTYRNTEAITLEAGQTLSVAISATEAGSASNAAAGAITNLVSTLLNVSVSNASALVGIDAEPDQTLRIRCKEKLGALSPFGPWDAYAYAARTSKRSSGETTGITRTRILKDGYGNVTLVAASASGPVLGTIGDTASDLGAVDEAIQRWAAPLCVAAHTESAAAVEVTVVYELWAYNTSGLTDAQLKSAVQSALATFFAAQPIGGALLSPGDASGKLYLDAVRAVISNAVDEVFHVAVTSPASDVALTGTQVAALVHNPLTHATVHQVAPPEGASL